MAMRGRKGPQRQKLPQGAERRALADLFERARKIRLLALDVDGVLTDGTIWMSPDGGVSKRFDIRDGHVLVHLPRHGVTCAIVSGRNDTVNELRAKDLRFGYVIQDAIRKLPAIRELAKRTKLSLEQIAYMGDDVNDVSAIETVGLGAAPADATPEAIAAARFVSSKGGGRGAVRELGELILKARGAWTEVLEGAR